MPTILEIFGKRVKFEETYIPVRDRKPKQCSYVSPSNVHPFVKRCTNPKMQSFTVCKEHRNG